MTGPRRGSPNSQARFKKRSARNSGRDAARAILRRSAYRRRARKRMPRSGSPRARMNSLRRGSISRLTRSALRTRRATARVCATTFRRLSMLKNSAEREELNRRRKQLLALDADVCFAVAALDGGVVSWLKYMVDERKMVFDTQELSAERINCTQATLRLL